MRASIVPYSGQLRPEVQLQFDELQKIARTDIRKALFKVHSLRKAAANSSDDVKVWVELTYAFLLLENDSLAKSELILNDSVRLKWTMDPWLRAYHSLDKAMAMTYQGKYAASEMICVRALESEIPSESVLAMNLQFLLADNLRYQGKHDQALVRWYKVLEIANRSKDSVAITDAHLGIGEILFVQEDYTESRKNVLIYQRFNLRIGNKKKQAYALSLIGLLEYQDGNYQKAIDLNLEGYEIRKKIGDVKGQGESLNNLALGYMGMQNWDQAFRYLQEAVQLKTQANDLTQMTVILNNMGQCQRKLGNTDAALNYFNLALEKGKENGQMADVIRSYKNLVGLYKSIKRTDLALDLQSKLIALKDSLAVIDRKEALMDLQVKYETDRVEQEVILLKQEKEIITNRWLSLALGLFLAIIIGILFIDNQKRKHRQEKELLLKEDELHKAEMKIMSDLLEHNRTKLMQYTESLLKKNELVGILESKVLSSVDSDTDLSEQDKKLIDDFTRVRILTDEDWDEFKRLFEGVHQGLISRLLRTHENLTLADQRLFLLMKLELSTKEIADILGVSPDTVKKGRYRLKKKIGNEQALSVQEIVASF